MFMDPWFKKYKLTNYCQEEVEKTSNISNQLDINTLSLFLILTTSQSFAFEYSSVSYL